MLPMQLSGGFRGRSSFSCKRDEFYVQAKSSETRSMAFRPAFLASHPEACHFPLLQTCFTRGLNSWTCSGGKQKTEPDHLGVTGNSNLRQSTGWLSATHFYATKCNIEGPVSWGAVSHVT